MIHCIGDSHSSVFSGEDVMQPVWPYRASNLIPYFKSYRIGPATAYQLETKKNIIESLISSLNLTSDDKLMFCFGEVDCRAHLIKQSKIQNRPIVDIVVECVDRYIEAIKYYKKYNTDIVVWGPIASWSNEKPYDGPSFGTNEERNWVTFAFNVALQMRCLSEGFKFVTIFYNMIDEKMKTNSYFLDDSGIHLTQKSMPIILNTFKQMELI